MAVHMQDSEEIFYSPPLKQLTFGHHIFLYRFRVQEQTKEKGKKGFGLEKFPSIIEVLNPNDLFDEKSKSSLSLFAICS